MRSLSQTTLDIYQPWVEQWCRRHASHYMLHVGDWISLRPAVRQALAWLLHHRGCVRGRWCIHHSQWYKPSAGRSILAYLQDTLCGPPAACPGTAAEQLGTGPFLGVLRHRQSTVQSYPCIKKYTKIYSAPLSACNDNMPNTIPEIQVASSSCILAGL